MIFDPDKHFLVLTRDGASDLRRIVAYPDGEESRLRNMLTCVLASGKLLRSYRTYRDGGSYRGVAGRVRDHRICLGTAVELACRSEWNFGTSFVATLVFGEFPDGRFKMSHDGLMQCVFLTGVRQ